MQQSPQTTSAANEIRLSAEERQPCEVWTRVMGYHRPVASFNIGKQGEHEARRSFAFCGTAPVEP